MRLIVLLALSFAVSAQVAWAHGGGVPQLTNVQAGPYRVSAWTQPDPIRMGEVHVSVAVSESLGSGATEREAGDLVLDATVRVQMQPMDQAGETLVAYATRENAVNKLFYEADLDLPAEGRWQVVIWVEGPTGAGSASFDVEALPPSAFSAIGALPWPVWGGLGLVLLAVGWSVQMFRGHKPEVQRA
jgi:hypothetical protein